MSDWIEALRSNAVISYGDYGTMLSSNANKSGRLSELARLCPSLTVPRTFVLHGASKKEVYQALDRFSGDRLDIRIVDSRGKTRRRHGLTKVQAKRYFDVAYVSGHKYDTTISEFIRPAISGTIISRGDALIAELARGPHYHLTQQTALPKYHGFFVDGRMIYDTTEGDLRQAIWQAASAIQINEGPYSPHAPPVFQKGYFEFLRTSDNRTIFTDFSRLGLFTKLPSTMGIVGSRGGSC